MKHSLLQRRALWAGSVSSFVVLGVLALQFSSATSTRASDHVDSPTVA